MADTIDTAVDLDDDVELTEYTTETPVTPEGAAARKPSASAPGAATGRRKQAVARVRIVPGTGEWKINGRSLDSYFPNKEALFLAAVDEADLASIDELDSIAL